MHIFHKWKKLEGIEMKITIKPDCNNPKEQYAYFKELAEEQGVLQSFDDEKLVIYLSSTLYLI